MNVGAEDKKTIRSRDINLLFSLGIRYNYLPCIYVTAIFLKVTCLQVTILHEHILRLVKLTKIPNVNTLIRVCHCQTSPRSWQSIKIFAQHKQYQSSAVS